MRKSVNTYVGTLSSFTWLAVDFSGGFCDPQYQVLHFGEPVAQAIRFPFFSPLTRIVIRNPNNKANVSSPDTDYFLGYIVVERSEAL